MEFRRMVPVLCTVLVSCSSDGGSVADPPPGPPTPAAVASVDISPSVSSVLAGVTVQLTASPRDAQGNALSGRTITWTSSNSAVAEVSNSGLVTTRTPGNVNITATVEARAGSASIESVDPTFIPVFQRPFSASVEARTSNFHDHNSPREFLDTNGIYLSWWGEQSLVGIDGHEGYDWQIPEGTPIVAVADGRVTVATLTNTPFFCPPLNRMVDDNVQVRIEHTLPGGVRVVSVYVHLNRIDVAAGALVTAGQQIGLSGNKGCSQAPHLHFAINRLTQLNAGTTFSPIDPYGWEGTGTDPWTQNAAGAASIRLWKQGEAPALFRSALAPLGATAGPFVQITTVRFQGVRDAATPNNEFIEITRDDRVAPAQLDISAFTLTTRAGVTFTFPAGTVLSAALPVVRVFAGTGTASASTLFWGRAAGVLDNSSDCVRFLNTAGQLRNQVGWGNGCQ